MQLFETHRQRPVAILTLLLLTACLGLAACGSSSSSPPSATGSSSRSSTTSTAPGTQSAGAPQPRGVAAMLACFKRSGFKLSGHADGSASTSKNGSQGAGAAPTEGFFIGGQRVQLPKGVSAAKIREAFGKCRAARLAVTPEGGSRIKSPVFKRALTRFAACAREHGVTLPTPNSSGTGPVFETKGLDRTSPKFKAAIAACRSLLSSVIGGGPSGGGAGSGASGAGSAAGG